MTARTDVANPFRGALRALSASFCKELDGSLHRDRLGRVATAQARVRLSVRHVRPEAPVLDDQCLSALRIVTELFEGRLRCAAAATWLRLCKKRLCLFDGEGEELLLRFERACLGAFLD